MPPRAGSRRLVPLRQTGSLDVKIRLLEIKHGENKGTIWAGCSKPSLPQLMTVESPGTTFARFALATPTFGGSQVNLNFPCPPKPWETPKQQFTGRPAPLRTRSQLAQEIINYVKPRVQQNKRTAMSNK